MSLILRIADYIIMYVLITTNAYIQNGNKINNIKILLKILAFVTWWHTHN